MAGLQRQCSQRCVFQAKQRGAQGAGQREVVGGGNQHIQQGHQVLHFRGVSEVGFFGLPSGDVERAQSVVQGGQAVAFAGQHHDVAWVLALRHLLGNPLRSLARLAHAQGVFGLLPRLGQGVAPNQIARHVFLRVWIVSWNGGQAGHAAGLCAAGGVGSKTCEFARFLRLCKHSVDRRQHGRRVAAGVVTSQGIATQAFDHKALGGLKHLRLGAAKAVDALLGVADDENAGGRAPCVTTASARITTQPGRQRLPLQRVGVLKFVNQHMFDARVQLLLHPATGNRVGQ